MHEHAKIQLLREQGELTRLQIMLEVMRSQPHVTQREIGESLGITIQAVCRHFRVLIDEGLLEAGSERGNYRLTEKAYEKLRAHLKRLELSVAAIKTGLKSDFSPAIADKPVRAGEKVELVMKGGVLRAVPVEHPTTGSCGVALDDAFPGEELRVTDLQGKVRVDPGRIQLLRLPTTSEGGSRAVDTARVKSLIESFRPERVGVIGAVGRAVLNKVGREADLEFGVARAAAVAASRGLRVLVLGVGRMVNRLIEEIDLEGSKQGCRILYEVYDVRASQDQTLVSPRM